MRHMSFCRHTHFATALQLTLLGLVLLFFCGSSPVSMSLTETRARTRMLANSDQLTIGVWMSNRDLEGEKRLLSSLSRPGGSAYRQWLSPASFQARFAPTAADVSLVQRFLNDSHLRLLPGSSSNLLLASGTFAQVERAFRTSIGMRGKYYGPFDTPKVSTAIAPIVTGVFGLTNQPTVQADTMLIQGNKKLDATGASYGGGIAGSGLTPSQIASIYNATPLYRQGNTGQGTTLGLVEFSGYAYNDIPTYENTYHLPHMPLVNIPVLGGASDHSGAGEVSLDIELQIAMAPGARRLLIYNAPNRDLGSIMLYDRVAQDNLVDAISTSWSACEYLRTSSI